MNNTVKWFAIVSGAILVGVILAGAIFYGGNWQGNGSLGTTRETASTYGYSQNVVEGYSPGMTMGWVYSGSQSNEKPLTLEQAWEAAEVYIANDPNLEISEIMAFTNNYYAQAREKDSGRYALELLIDPYTGAIYPEMGPNMMWNTRYGHLGNMRGGMRGMMGGGYYFPSQAEEAEMTVSPEEAVNAAQSYLDRVYPGATAVEPAAFYGYYTLHVLQDGATIGMLSVHGTTGQVWYHNWHGDLIGMIEEHN